MTFTKEWLSMMAERAIKTVAQTAIAAIGTTTLGLLDVDWVQVVSLSALAGVMSVLTSIAFPAKEMKEAKQ